MEYTCERLLSMSLSVACIYIYIYIYINIYISVVILVKVIFIVPLYNSVLSVRMHPGRLTIRPYSLHGNWNWQPRGSRNVNLINLPGEYDVHMYLKLGGMGGDSVTFLPTIIYGSARSGNL